MEKERPKKKFRQHREDRPCLESFYRISGKTNKNKKNKNTLIDAQLGTMEGGDLKEDGSEHNVARMGPPQDQNARGENGR